MSDKKDENITSDIILADLMLRVAVLEQLLLQKGTLNKEEVLKATEEIATKASKVVMERAQSSKSVEEFVSNLEKDN